MILEEDALQKMFTGSSTGTPPFDDGKLNVPSSKKHKALAVGR